MTIKKKIFTVGAVVFFIFTVLALMNIWTHQQILSSLQVRDEVNENLDSIIEFAKWRNEKIQSISDIVATGHVSPFVQEQIHSPSNLPTQESEVLMDSADRLVALIGEKEHASNEVEKTFGEFRTRINELYYKLDEKISTVLAIAQLDEVMGKDSSRRSSLAPYVLKSLNQLTLVASNILIAREYTEEQKSVVKNNEKFLSSQLHIIDDDGSIATLFKELFSEIESIDAYILESSQRLSEFESRITEAREDFDKAVQATEIDPLIAGTRLEVVRADERLEKASRRNLVTVIAFLFVVPIVVILVGIFGLNTLIVGPITHLVDAMKNVESGSYDIVAPVKTQDEIGNLARSFNTMAGEIKAKVTELSDLNKTLKESEAKYRTLVNNLPQRIFLKDKNLVYVSCNHNYAQDMGINENEIVGKTDFDFFPKTLAEKYRADDARILQLEKSEEIEEAYVQNGEEIIIQTVKTPIRDEQGTVSGVLGIFWDITDRKQAEEERKKLQDQLIQVQKLESIGRLAGGIAHDFNNMLAVIMGHIDMAIEKLKSSEPIYEDLEEVQKAAERSSNLTRQLLAFARKQVISPQILELNDIIVSMLKMLQRLIGEDIELIWKPAANLWPVMVDLSQVDQILANLSINARDAITGVGQLIIETENTIFSETYSTIHSNIPTGEYVQLSVSDTGCGMDKETLQQIFEPFFTTKELGKGTGLGLATVYGIVKQNDGFINVYSEPGQGTTFKIYLPRVDAEVAEKPKEVERNLYRGTETVLLVEDEKAILSMAQNMLERYGYSVLSACNPVEALSLAEQYEGPIQLLITDVVMPGMNGKDLRDKLEVLIPGIKTLFISGYTVDVIAHRGIIDEGVHLLQKPFSSNTLAQRIREILD